LEQNFNTCASTEHINPAMNNAHIIAAWHVAVYHEQYKNLTLVILLLIFKLTAVITAIMVIFTCHKENYMHWSSLELVIYIFTSIGHMHPYTVGNFWIKSSVHLAGYQQWPKELFFCNCFCMFMVACL
jgi:hypothetical protein